MRLASLSFNPWHSREAERTNLLFFLGKEVDLPNTVYVDEEALNLCKWNHFYYISGYLELLCYSILGLLDRRTSALNGGGTVNHVMYIHPSLPVERVVVVHC
jgi:hypothetical protein